MFQRWRCWNGYWAMNSSVGERKRESGNRCDRVTRLHSASVTASMLPPQPWWIDCFTRHPPSPCICSPPPAYCWFEPKPWTGQLRIGWTVCGYVKRMNGSVSASTSWFRNRHNVPKPQRLPCKTICDLSQVNYHIYSFPEHSHRLPFGVFWNDTSLIKRYCDIGKQPHSFPEHSHR